MTVRPASLHPMQKPLIEPWTVDDFLAWGRAQEERYEFGDGIVRMMVGGTLAHASIKGDIYVSLREQLGGSRCRVFVDGPKVVPAAASMYPDAVVTCAPALAPDADGGERSLKLQRDSNCRALHPLDQIEHLSSIVSRRSLATDLPQPRSALSSHARHDR